MPTEPIRASEIPDEFFTALAFMVPYANKIARDECGVSVGAIFVMMHLMISGKDLEKKGYTMLRNDLTKLLDRRGFSPAGASRLILELEEKGFVERTFISPAVRQEAFDPADRSYTQAVVLKKEGENKIAEFKAALRAHFGHWLVNEARKQEERSWLALFVRKLLASNVAIKLARSLIDRIAAADFEN
jgi:DNA-binding MarR family transcriptional regulator